MIIGLTGGIASGKSTVTNILKSRGAYIIDCDLIAREVVEPGRPALEQIVQRFGAEMLSDHGTLNRPALAKRIFANDDDRELLNQIIHPYIFAEIDRRIAHAKSIDAHLIVVDAPLLIETNLHKIVERVVLVYVDGVTQLHRLMHRDQIDEAEAKRRIASQMPLEEKRKYADYILENSGTIQDLEQQVNQLWLRVEENHGRA